MTQEANNQTQQSQNNQMTTGQEAQKPKQKRTRKTIEQELAELEARKQKLLESKRKAETHEKIIFGATVIAMLKDMQKNGDPTGRDVALKLNNFAQKLKIKDINAIIKIVNEILEIKPIVKPQPQLSIQVNQQYKNH